MNRMGGCVLILFFLTTSLVYAEDWAKVAVAAEEAAATASVSGKAARSPYFLIFDGTGALLEAVDNPHKQVKRGAGALVAGFLAQKGVNLVVAGEFGDRMIHSMKREGMEHLEFVGTVDGALKKVQEGRK